MTGDSPLARAAADLAGAQARAGVTVVVLDTLPALLEACRLWNEVWARDGEAPVAPELLRALAHAGNYVAAAYDGGRMVGAALGFFAGAERADHLHSHMTGVDGAMRGRGVGFALKLHQRVWALERGLDRITWTYDPLVRVNGVFNLGKLAAEGVDYLVDFYGAMPDAINAGDQTDRVLVRWELTDPHVVAAAGGTPRLLEAGPLLDAGATIGLDVGPDDAPLPGSSAGAGVLCRVPADIVALRRRDAALGRAWRLALRDLLLTAMDRGQRLRGITGDGWYVLGDRRPPPQVAEDGVLRSDWPR